MKDFDDDKVNNIIITNSMMKSYIKRLTNETTKLNKKITKFNKTNNTDINLIVQPTLLELETTVYTKNDNVTVKWTLVIKTYTITVIFSERFPSYPPFITIDPAPNIPMMEDNKYLEPSMLSQRWKSNYSIYDIVYNIINQIYLLY